MKSSWDIFCRVVDNFGDAGVCWRLARQLVAEHGRQVRLWIDELSALAPLAPGLSIGSAVQRQGGLELRRWSEPWTETAPADVVIEAFGGGLPPAFVEAMAGRSRSPVWINLEYLSAEAWVEACHRLPSPQARLPLTKFFYFPGFTPATGGLLRERDLLKTRDTFLASAEAQVAFWRSLGLAGVPEGRKVSLFCYPESPIPALLEVWAGGAEPVFCLVPEGYLAQDAAAFLGGSALAPGAVCQRGALKLACFRFLPQDGYDRLLWACDLNFVRGEDSFVRAQWAGRPMVWQPYRQDAGAHLAKLQAFLDRQNAFLPGPAGEALLRWSRAWSGQGSLREAWAQYVKFEKNFSLGAQRWAESLAKQPDLATQLVEFAENADIMRGSPNQ